MRRKMNQPIETFYDINLVTNCWNWNGCIVNGYGRYRKDGETTLAHRVLYEKYKGQIPHKKVIDHLCRNKKCVNPEHLEVVEQAQNVQRGNRSVLTEFKVAKIREKYPFFTERKLALEFNVSHNTIHQIVTNNIWKGIF